MGGGKREGEIKCERWSVFVCVCLCVDVCERERERERAQQLVIVGAQVPESPSPG